jgi:hypothetical protein
VHRLSSVGQRWPVAPGPVGAGTDPGVVVLAQPDVFEERGEPQLLEPLGVVIHAALRIRVHEPETFHVGEVDFTGGEPNRQDVVVVAEPVAARPTGRRVAVERPTLALSRRLEKRGV